MARNDRSRSSKVIDFGTKCKPACFFLLFIHSWSYLAPFWRYVELKTEIWPISVALTHSARPPWVFPVKGCGETYQEETRVTRLSTVMTDGQMDRRKVWQKKKQKQFVIQNVDTKNLLK